MHPANEQGQGHINIQLIQAAALNQMEQWLDRLKKKDTPEGKDDAQYYADDNEYVRIFIIPCRNFTGYTHKNLFYVSTPGFWGIVGLTGGSLRKEQQRSNIYFQKPKIPSESRTVSAEDRRLF
jgi:hypothetical protein